MMNRRALLITLALGPAAATAQDRRFRIGWLVFGAPPLGEIDRTLIDALAERGFSDGGKLEIVFRYAKGDLTALADLAADLVAQKPDLLIAIGGEIVRALFTASDGVIPVIGGTSENPVRAGLARTLGHPGMNFTGVTYLTDELAAKRLELLKETAPNSKRVAVIWHPQHMDDEFVLARRAAENLGFTLTSHEVDSSDTIDIALRNAKAANVDSLFVIPSRLTRIASPTISRYAIENRWPVVTSWRELVVNGCLVSYGPSRMAEARRLVDSVMKIMQGAKPADIPIQAPTRFELVVNIKTAKALGLTVPESLLARADEVIE
jgi:putative ABC transport system substrate-binding protein